MVTTCAPTRDVGGQHRAAQQDAAAADTSTNAGTMTSGAINSRVPVGTDPELVESARDGPSGLSPAGTDEQRGLRKADDVSDGPQAPDVRDTSVPTSAGSSSRKPTRSQSEAERHHVGGLAAETAGGHDDQLLHGIRLVTPTRSTSITRDCSDSFIWWNSGRISVLSVRCSVCGRLPAAAR